MNQFAFLFRSFSISFGILAFIVLISGSWSLDELLQPVRIDSLYIETLIKSDHDSMYTSDTDIVGDFYFSPSEAGLEYRTIISGPENNRIHSWYIEPKGQTNSVTLVVLHDLGESSIQYIEFAKQFAERGFRMVLTDLRAHGQSDGEYFYPGAKAEADLRIVIDSIYNLPETVNVCLMGIGVSSETAARFTLHDQRPGVLILQNPYYDISEYLSYFCEEKWGRYATFYKTVALRNLSIKHGLDLQNMNMASVIDSLSKPVMFVQIPENPALPGENVLKLFNEAGSAKKEIIGVKPFELQSEEDTDSYFNRIAIFMLLNSAQPFKKSKFKKLATL